MPSRQQPGSRAWLGLGEASDRLGISPTTLRRWSDAGVIATFVTPGGHRRFSTDAVDALLPATRNPTTVRGLGETPDRMTRAYRRVTRSTRPLPWIGALDGDTRSRFRDHGRLVAAELLAMLDAGEPDEAQRHLDAACEASAGYGREAALGGVPASATIEAFLRFRRPFLDELWDAVRRREVDLAGATDLIRRASDAFDGLLVSTMRSWEAGLDGRPLARGGRRATLAGDVRRPTPPSLES
jgi:excisionase family DNA binding protein